MKNKSLILLVMPLVFIVIAVVSWQCIEMPLSPVAPASTVSLGNIPLVDITKYFSEYEQKSANNFLVVDSTVGVYDYVNKQSAAKQTIALPTASATDTSIRVAVGTFSIGSLSASQSVAASNVSSLLPNGTYPGFTPQNFKTVGSAFDNSSQFDFVLLTDTATNSMSMSVTNTLGLPIVFTDSVVLRNNSSSPFDTNKVAAFFGRNDTIASGVTMTKTSSIRKKILRGAMKMDSIKIYTPGTTKAFTVDINSKVSFALTASNLVADSALAVVPTQVVYSPGSSAWQIDDSTVLSSATFDAGLFQLKFYNNLNIKVGMTLKIDKLIDLTTNSSYTVNTTVAGKDSLTLPFDMTKYKIEGGGTGSNQFGTQLSYTATITTLNSEGAKKLVGKSDNIKAALIHNSDFVLKSITGRIRTTVVNIDQRFPSNIDVRDLKGYNGSIALDSIYLAMNLPMGGNDGCEANYHLTIIAKNTQQHRSDSLVIISGTSPDYKLIEPGVGTQIILRSKTDSAFFNSLTRYFPNVPDSFYVRGSVTLDPNFVTKQVNYTFNDTSGIYPTFDIHLPLRVQIGNSTYAQTMAFDSSQIPTDFTKNVGQGSASFTVVNNLPLQMQMKAEFLKYNKTTRKNDILFTLPDTSINKTDVMRIAAAPVTVSSGWASGTTQSTSTVSLNSTDMGYFNQTDSIRVTLYNLQSTNGQTVRVLGSNYIRIVGIGNITYTIKSK